MIRMRASVFATRRGAHPARGDAPLRRPASVRAAAGLPGHRAAHRVLGRVVLPLAIGRAVLLGVLFFGLALLGLALRRVVGALVGHGSSLTWMDAVVLPKRVSRHGFARLLTRIRLVPFRGPGRDSRGA